MRGRKNLKEVCTGRGVARGYVPAIRRLASRAISLILVLCPVLPASAGAGWYLLQPPLRQGVTDEAILRDFPKWRDATKQELHEIAPLVMGDWDAPLHRWTHKGSFDTAAECEAVLIRLMKAAEAEEPELRRKYPDGYPTLKTTLLMESRCIAPNDPRLLPR